MADQLQHELRQRKPFPSLEVEALLSISRTADALNRYTQRLLKRNHISPTQYNVLRILRGAGKDGLPCSQIGARLVHQDPDITRLLYRLENLGLIRREREEGDKRVVLSRITEQGLCLLDAVSPQVDQSATDLLGSLGHQRLQAIIDSLDEVRNAVARAQTADQEAPERPDDKSQDQQT